MGPVSRWYRSLRYGRPIVVVSGLPRSGTSMAVRMLEAGGMGVVTDGLRTADDSNPKGYFELERVKSLGTDSDTSWLVAARGRAIKIISFLLRDLPETNNYRVLFMHRHMDEILASQRRMLIARQEPDTSAGDDRLSLEYARHLIAVTRVLATRPCFETLDLRHADVVARPLDEATRIRRFLGLDLDVSKMAAAVDETLYRNRR